MQSPAERLVYMANQIARNFAAQGRAAASRATADHIATFWDPTMRARILLVDAGKLEPITIEAITLLRSRGALPPQSEATRFSPDAFSDGSDAG